jgi:hypothetical protein
LGGGVTAAVGVSVVVAMSGGAQAVMVLEGIVVDGNGVFGNLLLL